MRRLGATLLLSLLGVSLVPVTATGARPSCAGVERSGTWTKVATPLPALSFAVDPGGRLFVAGERTIMSSGDGGCTWRGSFELPAVPSAESPFPNARFAALASSGGSVVAALTGPHVLVSGDGGSTWARADEGLDVPGDPVGLYAAPTGDVLYLVVRQGATDRALPAAAGVAEQGISALATIVYRSADGGRTWERRGDPGLSYSGPHGSDVDGGRAPGAVWDLAVDPVDPNHLLVAARDGIFRSLRGGDDWQPVVFEPGIQVRTVAMSAEPGARRAAVAVDPRTGTLYSTGDVTAGRWERRTFPQLQTEQMLGYPNAAPWAWSSFGAGGEPVLSGPKGMFRWTGGALLDDTPPGLGGLERSAVDLTLVEGALWSRLYDGSALLTQTAAPPSGTTRRDGTRPSVTPPRVPPVPGRIRVPDVEDGGVELVAPARRVELDPGDTVTLTYEARLQPRPTAVDLFFLLDTTASMSDAIRGLREGMQDIVLRLARSRIVLRAGVGAFRTYPRESDRVVENYAYRRIRRLGPVDGDLLRSLYEIEARGTSGANLAALLQAVTGGGQDVLPPGPSKADIPADGEAGFRAGALRVVFHFADTWFGTPERGDPNGSYAPGTWPGPGFGETLAALRAADVHHLGVAMQPSAGGTVLADADVADDLRTVSEGTSSLAGERGADCDGDGTSELAGGAPLVCPLARDADSGSLASVVVGLVEALEDRGPVELVERSRSGMVRGIAPPVYPDVDLRGPQQLEFEVAVGCGAADAGARTTVRLDLRVAGGREASAPLRVACTEAPAAAAPRAPVRPNAIVPLIPPIPVPPPPHTVPGLGPGSVAAPAPVQAPAPAQAPGGQPQATLVAQRQQQPQLAFVAAAQEVRAQTQMQHAMVRTRARDPLAAARTWTAVGGLTILWAWGLAVALAASPRRARV